MGQDIETYGRTIQLFLVDGTPNGLAIASIHGWTGSVLVASQANFARLLARPEVDRTGIYILFGPDPDDHLSTRAYIGEADSVRERVAQSAGVRGFWETAIVITTSDEALTKGHVRYLEARLIQGALDAGRIKLDNGQLPAADRRRLPEADRANMEAFLANLRVILPVVGLELLKPRPLAARQHVSTEKQPEREANSSSQSVRGEFEIRHKSGVKAMAVEEDGEFVVLAGSQSLKDTGYTNNTYGALKQELISKSVLKDGATNDVYEFSQSYAFSSPSAASAVVLDRNSNGRIEWKLVGSALTYHQWQEKQAEAEEAHQVPAS